MGACAGTCHGWSIVSCEACGAVQACGKADCCRCEGDPGPKVRGSLYEGDPVEDADGRRGVLVRWLGDLRIEVRLSDGRVMESMFGTWRAVTGRQS